MPHLVTPHALTNLSAVNRLASALPAFRTPLAPVEMTHAAGPEEPGQSQVSFQPGDLLEGCQVEYYSSTDSCWIPCVIVHVNAETGDVKLSVKPNHVLDFQEQQRRLRPRIKPNEFQLTWVRSILREGRVDEEAKVIFSRHAHRHKLRSELRLEELAAVAAELNSKLGVSGSVCVLRHALSQLNGYGLSVDDFSEVFWELLWAVQRDFCLAEG